MLNIVQKIFGSPCDIQVQDTIYNCFSMLTYFFSIPSTINVQEITCLADWDKVNFSKGYSFFFGMDPKEKLVVLLTRTYISLIKWLFLLEDSPNSSGLGTTFSARLYSISSTLSSSISLFSSLAIFSRFTLMEEQLDVLI